MKLLKETSDDELSLKMWRVDQSFMDTISELGSDMVSELLDKLEKKMSKDNDWYSIQLYLDVNEEINGLAFKKIRYVI